MVGSCVNCGAPLPKTASIRRKYCNNACKNQYWRRLHSRTTPAKRDKLPPNPIDNAKKIPPGEGTGIPELDKILFMGVETTLKNTLLKDLLEQRRQQGIQEGLAQAQAEKEETHLDASTARRLARILAKERYA